MITFSLVVPVYRNEGSIDELLQAVDGIAAASGGRLEAIYVVDGSPDTSYAQLREKLPSRRTASKLITHSRNFGSFAAVRTGLQNADGAYAAVMAADLQEPPELIVSAFQKLVEGDCDIVFGLREAREDPWLSKLAAGLFWTVYRRLVQRDVPPGGVDVFAVNRPFLDRLLSFEEANGSLLGLLFWMGGRKSFVTYRRRERKHGKSAWTLGKKIKYLFDSVFAFTDAPIQVLLYSGLGGVLIAAVLAVATLWAKLSGVVDVPGYAATMLAVLFFGGLNTFGLGLVGSYAWRAYENTKRRPLAIATRIERFGAVE